jgi:hypothetical protein
MAAPGSLAYGEVVLAVDRWPRERRLALMRHLLETIDDDTAEKERRRREAFDRLEGILATDAPPPTDEEVEQWLEEERLKRYG